jgi:ubiquinone/menaquinone biosynthesis C-methylase UbiE
MATGRCGLSSFRGYEFDVVVSQFALMYFPDRVASLRQMWRALAPRGRLAIAAWAPIDHARGYQILADMVSDDVMQALAAESENALAEFVVPSGEIVMPMDAHIVTAGKG